MFGNRLRIARKNMNLTLEQLAAIYNSKYDGKLSKGTLSKYENDKQEPMMSVVANLSVILGVSVDYLLEISDETKSSDTRNEEFNSNAQFAKETDLRKRIQDFYGKQAVKILDLFSQLNSEGQQKAVDALSDLTEIPKYTHEKIYVVKKAARNGNFQETTITDSNLQRINDLPDVDDLE